MRRCPGCGAAYSTPVPPPEELTAWYSETYFRQFYGGDRRVATVRCSSLLDLVSTRLTAPCRLLDVGCGVGDLAVAALGRGWQVVGLEVSEAAVRQAVARGVPVIQGDAALTLQAAERRQVPELRQPFDLAVFRDTLGHLPAVWQVLMGAMKRLRAGGWLLVRVPNRHPGVFRLARLAGLCMDTSGVLHLPAQILHLDRRSLHHLLGRLGLERILVEGDSEGVRESGGRYSRRRWADALWKICLAHWQRRGEPEVLLGWGQKP